VLTRPPGLRQALARPRLIDLAGDAALVVVTGPVGSGVTTAVAQLATAASRGQAVWCRLSPGYDTAGDVVAVISATLGAATSNPVTVLELADALLELFDGPGAGATVLAIDDYDLAGDSTLDQLLGECLPLLPVGFRTVIGTATRPAGLLGRAGPAAAVLDAAALAFTDGEAVALFAAHGAPAERALAWNRALDGWVAGVAAGVLDPHADPTSRADAIVRRLAEPATALTSVLDVAAVAPYVTADLLDALATPVERLADAVAGVPLLTDHAGYVRLAAGAAAARRSQLGPARVAELRRAVGGALADSDPVAAIEVLLAAEAYQQAADVLAGHLSEVGVERALAWVYQMPPELRRQFPPVLTAGRATVEVDTALAAARHRVAVAPTPVARREALLALGSVELHRGELAAAAAALEAALRAGAGDRRFAELVAAQLAQVRFHLGDTIGARAALEASPDDAATRWLAAQIEIAEGGQPRAGVDGSLFDSVIHSAGALLDGDVTAAARSAEAAYSAAVTAGGDLLVAAGPALAWVRLREGRPAEAVALAEQWERQLGAGHLLARLHGALVRVHAGVSPDPDRDLRRLRDLRGRGFAPLERMVARLVSPSTPAHPDVVLVTVVGQHAALVGGRVIGRSAWNSRKALDVLTVLATAAGRGVRREALIEAVWPGRDPEKGRGLLRAALSEIRRTIEPGRLPGEPSAFLGTAGDLVQCAAELDLDRAEAMLAHDPRSAFDLVADGLAAELEEAEWARDLAARLVAVRVRAATRVSADAEVPEVMRVAAFEALIEAEPWNRAHYDALAQLHRAAGNDADAADAERRWFATD